MCFILYTIEGSLRGGFGPCSVDRRPLLLMRKRHATCCQLCTRVYCNATSCFIHRFVYFSTMFYSFFLVLGFYLQIAPACPRSRQHISTPRACCRSTLNRVGIAHQRVHWSTFNNAIFFFTPFPIHKIQSFFVNPHLPSPPFPSPPLPLPSPYAGVQRCQSTEARSLCQTPRHPKQQYGILW